MTVYLIILIAIGVGGKQSQKYYVHVLGAIGTWLVLMPTAVWLSDRLDSPAWAVLDFLVTGVAWAIPIVIVANGYERKGIYRLIPKRRQPNVQ